VPSAHGHPPAATNGFLPTCSSLDFSYIPTYSTYLPTYLPTFLPTHPSRVVPRQLAAELPYQASPDPVHAYPVLTQSPLRGLLSRCEKLLPGEAQGTTGWDSESEPEPESVSDHFYQAWCRAERLRTRRLRHRASSLHLLRGGATVTLRPAVLPAKSVVPNVECTYHDSVLSSPVEDVSFRRGFSSCSAHVFWGTNLEICC